MLKLSLRQKLNSIFVISWFHLEVDESWVLLSYYAASINRLRLKCDGTRPETRFRPSAKRTSPFKSSRASVQSTTGSRGARISGSNAGYTMFRGSVKGNGYPLHPPLSPSLHLPCVSVCHDISTGVDISGLPIGPLKIGPIGCPETSVRDYLYSLRNDPEELSYAAGNEYSYDTVFITVFIYKCTQINIGLHYRTHMLVPTSQLSNQLAKFNHLNAKLIPIFHLLALLGAHRILHVRRMRVNQT